MNVPLRVLKAALWSVQDSVSSQEKQLRPALKNKVELARQLIADGSVSMSSGNGHSVSFAGAGAGQHTAQDALEGWVYLVEAFDVAYAALGGDPSDAEVVTQMEIGLRPVMGHTSNFMYLAK